MKIALKQAITSLINFSFILSLTFVTVTITNGQRGPRSIRHGRTAPASNSSTSSETEDRRGPAFVGFPLNQPRTIDLEIDEDALDGLSSREKIDQIRDWLLLAVISDSGLSTGTMNKILYDLPALRRGYMQPVGSFEYGETRSRYLGKGQVIALLPSGDENVRVDQLAQIVDEHRKNTGDMPTAVTVFEYEINLPTQTAQIIRREELNGQQLFTDKYGYYEARINKLSDLERFMSQVDNLSYADLDGDSVVLGGRKIKSRAYRDIRVEDVAAIWKSEAAVRSKLDRFEARFKALEEEYNAVWRLFAGVVNNFAKSNTVAANKNADKLLAMVSKSVVSGLADSQYSKPSPGLAVYTGVQAIIAAFNSNDAVAFNAEVARLTKVRDQQYAELREQIQNEHQSLQIVGGSGFSLDPIYDFEGLTKFFIEKLEPPLHQLAQKAPSILTLNDIERAKKGLADKDADPFLLMLGKLQNAGYSDLARDINWGTKSKYAFQHARYDGELQGTEVGMVLFYTDLLAKLWALDFLDSTPTSQIKDFYSLTTEPISPIFQANIRSVPSTRLWFGPRNQGFQFAGATGNHLLFARRATRVYSASSDPFKPGKEVEANAASAAFLNWWDSHYEEIARYEPEYERLNEIMKWSVMVGWLSNANRLSGMSFLKDVSVNHSNWFPTWAAGNSDLRFQQWGEINFYPSGYKNTTTEALPLLSTEFTMFGQPHILRGGVSLGGKETFVARKPLTPDIKISEVVRRSDVDYGAVQISAGRGQVQAVKNLDGTTYTFKTASPDHANLVAAARKDIAYRDRYSELNNNLSFERTISRAPEGLTLQTSAGHTLINEINFAKTDNGFKIGSRSRSIDAAHSLARRLSRIDVDPDHLLSVDPEVEAAFRLPGDYEYVVKIRGSQSWLRVGLTEDSSRLPSRWESRVADLDDSTNLSLRWVTEQAARSEVNAKHGTNLRTDGSAVSPSARFERIDSFLADNKPVKALREINDLIHPNHPQPDLLLRRALAELSRGRTAEATQSLDEGLRALPSSRNANDVFDEISARLALPRAEGLFIRKGDNLLGYRLSGSADALTTSSADVDLPAYLFIQDDPGLNSLDWSPSMAEQSLQQVISRDMGKIVRLPRGPISRFRPAVIEEPNAGRSYRYGGPSGPRFSDVVPCIPIDHRDQRTGRRDNKLVVCGKDKDDESDVYLVVAKKR